MENIPFNKPSFLGKEIEYLLQALEIGHISGNGPFTKKCEALLEEYLGVPKVLLTTSCTHALEMAAILLNIQPGDEIIVPSFTFVSTINAFVLRGARPVFIDIRPDTLNMDESKLEELITSRTKAIIPVHYAGVGCEMDELCDIAAQYDVPIVEDNAHGLFAKYKGNHLGTFGAMATQSFHETKNIICGEGGALLINDQEYIHRAEMIREKGTNRNEFFRGQVDKYTWKDIGSSYVMSDLLAAVLAGQLEMRDTIQEMRRKVFEYYELHLRDWAQDNDVRLPYIPPHCEQSYHMFYMIAPSFEKRQELIHHLKSKGILSVFHYVPLHTSHMGLKWGYDKGDYPITEQVSDRLVRLPFYTNIQSEELARVKSAILETSM